MKKHKISTLIYQITRVLSKITDMDEKTVDRYIAALNSVDDRWAQFYAQDEDKTCQL